MEIVWGGATKQGGLDKCGPRELFKGTLMTIIKCNCVVFVLTVTTELSGPRPIYCSS